MRADDSMLITWTVLASVLLNRDGILILLNEVAPCVTAWLNEIIVHFDEADFELTFKRRCRHDHACTIDLLARNMHQLEV